MALQRHERKWATADKLEAMIEADLRAHGCNGSVKVVAVGDNGDWTAAVGGHMSDEATRAYIVLLNKLKRDLFLDYGD
jgi:hypothetical protein